MSSSGLLAAFVVRRGAFFEAFFLGEAFLVVFFAVVFFVVDLAVDFFRSRLLGHFLCRASLWRFFLDAEVLRFAVAAFPVVLDLAFATLLSPNPKSRQKTPTTAASWCIPVVDYEGNIHAG